MTTDKLPSVRVRVLTRTKRQGTYLPQGTELEISREEAQQNAHIYCPVEDFAAQQSAAQQAEEKAAQAGTERHKAIKAGFQMAARGAAEAQAVTETARIEQQKQVAQAATKRAKKAAEIGA